MKQVKMEWRHLSQDGQTCDRCADTGREVHRAANGLKKLGWNVSLTEVLLTEKDLADSNLVLINGTPIEDILPGSRKSENCCASCGNMLGAPAMCRTVEYMGQTHEAIPASMIMEAVALITKETME